MEVRPASSGGSRGTSGTPCRQSMGIDPPVAIRRGEGAQRKRVDVVWGLPRCVWARESTAPAQGNQSLSLSGGGGKPSFPSPSAGDLRELPRVPLRGEGSCGGETGLLLRCAGKAGNPFQTTQGWAPPPPQDPSPLRGTLGSSLRSPAEGEGNEGFPPPPDKDLEHLPPLHP